MDQKSTIDWRAIFRSTAGVGFAAAMGQALNFFASPVISRLFTQEQFGCFGLFFSLANVLAIPATLGLQDAMFATAHPHTRDALQQAAVRLLFISVPVLGLIGWLVIAGDWLGYGALPDWAAVPLMAEVATLALIAIFQTRIVRERRYSLLAGNHLALGFARPGSQIGAGYLGTGFAGLMAAELGSRLAVLAMLWHACGAAARAGWRTVSPAERASAVREFRAFLFFRTPSALIFNVGTALPPTLIASAYGVSAAGLYAFMFSVIVAPIGLAQKAVGDVFIGHFAELLEANAPEARHYFQRMVLLLLGVATVPTAVLWFAGPHLFAWVFGEPWREAGQLAALFSPLFLCDLALGPVTGVLNVLNRPQLKLVFDVLRVVGILVAYGGARAAGAALPQMVQWLAWAGCIGYVVYLGLMWQTVKHLSVNRSPA